MNDDIDKAIEQLEKQIQYLQHDYEVLLYQQHALNDLSVMRMQIKQAEESLRLKKRMRYAFLN